MNTAPETLTFAQPWRDAPEPGFQTGSATLLWLDGLLHAEARLVDNHVHTRARKDNESLWELGDTLELFLNFGGTSDYVELHVAPGNLRMHLRLSRDPATSEPGQHPGLVREFVSPPAFTSDVCLTAVGWTVKAVIDPAVLGLGPVTEHTTLRHSFCRYDAHPDGRTILSTTSAHRVADFHRLVDWRESTLRNLGR